VAVAMAVALKFFERASGGGSGAIKNFSTSSGGGSGAGKFLKISITAAKSFVSHLLHI